MIEFTATSGAKVKINVADFEDAQNLKFAIQKALKNENVELSSLNDLMSSDAWPIAKIIMAVDSSKDVNEAIWPCLARCSRNGDKITKMTFEPVDARKDYYEIVVACVKENILPLFEGVFALSKSLFSKPQGESQK